MNGETKRHIDAARQVLVGVVPNPTSQIDQITNALIYKFMDDMDQAAIKAGGKPSFFVGDLEKYAWTRLMDSKIGSQERMNLYAEGFIKLSESKKIPELFRSILKSAYLPYRSPEVLDLFLREINYFDYSHPEELGNAYEYLLSIMSSQGDAGQFRTPRHIIDFIVAAVNPTKDEKILDPACGTAGFLISAYRHILSRHDGSKGKEKPLTPDQRRNLMSNFEGYDIDPGMVRISQVNMYLHQFKDPKIFQYDSLSSDERWGDKFDVILANPPFMSPKGGIRPHSKFAVQSNRSEVLFVDYIMSHLRPKGRAGIIVPEGIIFQSGTAYKQLRKNLIEDGLSAVVSLPSGVFNPYAGVKTSVLFFDNDQARKKDEILFIKISNDGFDLGATKRPIDKNDLPEALEILNKWHNGEKSSNKIASYVSREKIAEGGEYNLSADRYGVSIDYSNAKWPMVKLGDVAEILNGYAFKSENYSKDGIRVIRITNVQKGEIVDDDPKFYPENSLQEIKKFLLKKDDLLVSLTGNVGRVGMIKENLLPAGLNQRVGCIRVTDNDNLLISYLFHVLNTDLFENACIKSSSGIAQKNLSTEWLKKYQFPLPPLEIQKQIVEELDSYQKIISGAQQVVENWKPRIDIDPKWNKIKIGKIANFIDDGDWIESKDQSSKGIRLIQTGNIGMGEYIDKSGKERYVSVETFARLKCTEIFAGDVLLSRLPDPVGRACMLPKLNERTITAVDCTIFRFNSQIEAMYFVAITSTNEYQKEIDSKLSGATRQRISKGNLLEIEIPLPTFDIQKKIVEEIEAEKMLVKSNRKLIDIYEQKIREVITKLWEK